MYQIANLGKGGLSFRNSESVSDSDRKNVWIHAVAKTDKDLEGLRKSFGLDHLAIEDCVDRRQRPKIEIFDKYMLVIVKVPEVIPSLTLHQLSFIFNCDYLITISDGKVDEIEKVMRQFSQKDAIKNPSPGFIVYRILNEIVDSYFPILDDIEAGIAKVEKEAVERPTMKAITENIFKIRKKLITMRKASWPMRDVISSLSKAEYQRFCGPEAAYYRDVYDHIAVVIDLEETYLDLLMGVLEVYMSAISNNLNEVMKVLTVIATIFMPLTFIAGLYGMNFQNGGVLNMPETYWEFGYPFVLTLCLIIGLSMYVYFKRKHWI